MTDQELMDAEAAAKALMRDAAEVTALRARVKELEEALRGVADFMPSGEDPDMLPCWCGEWDYPLDHLNCCDRARRALHRPTPSQERP